MAGWSGALPRIAVPVREAVATTTDAPRPGGADLPHGLSGAPINGGAATAEVTATGADREIVEIGNSMARSRSKRRNCNA